MRHAMLCNPGGLARDTRFILFDGRADSYYAKALWLFLGVYFGAFCVAALLTPPFVMLAQQLAEGAEKDSFWSWLAGHPFHRYFDRFRMLSVVIMLPLLMRYLRLWSWRALGFDHQWRRLFLWLGIGWGMLALVAIAQVAGVGFAWDDAGSWSGLAGMMLVALLGGLLLGLLEELIFRGLVFRVFYTALSPGWAVLFSSLLFALAHFKYSDFDRNAPVEWYSGMVVGWKVAWGAFYNFDWVQFANLLLAGCLLCLVFLRTRSLWPCVGIHAGWICFRNAWRDGVEVEPAARWFWGTESMTNGVLPLVLMAVIALWLYRGLSRQLQDEAAS